MEPVFRAAVEELSQERPVAVATVVRTSGSTPQKPGAKLLVRADGSGVGTLGGGCVEGDIWFAAQELMKRGGAAEMRDYQLNEDLAAQDGLVCGGTMYFLIDPIRRSEDYVDFAAEVVAAYEGGEACRNRQPDGGSGGQFVSRRRKDAHQGGWQQRRNAGR